MNASQILAGSLLATPKKGVLLQVIDHVGVALGNGLVFHNTPERGEHVSSFADFSKGRPVTVTAQLSHHDFFQTLNRVRQILQAPRSYDVWQNNCEHSLSLALGRPVKSTQLRAWSISALLVFGCLMLQK